jgi:hypothetical protein
LRPQPAPNPILSIRNQAATGNPFSSKRRTTFFDVRNENDLIDESYGWLALGFSTTWTTKIAQTGDELCRFRRILSERCEALIRTLAAHE